VQRGVRVVHLGLVGQADLVACLVQQEDLFRCHAGHLATSRRAGKSLEWLSRELVRQPFGWAYRVMDQASKVPVSPGPLSPIRKAHVPVAASVTAVAVNCLVPGNAVHG